MRKTFYPTVLLATLISACTLSPRYEKPIAPIADAYPTGAAYQNTSADKLSIPAAEIGWRQFFGDPGLQRLIEIMLDNNRDLRIAALNLEKVRAQYQIQRSKLVPQLNAVGSQSRNRTPGNVNFSPDPVLLNSYTVGAAASWELDFFGKVQSLKNKALAEYLASAQARKAAEMALVAQVAKQYLVMRAYDEQLEVTRSSLETAQQLYKLAQIKVETGLSSELDRQQAEGAIEQARANYQAQLRLRAQAENALALLIGEPIPADLPAPLPLNSQQILVDIQEGMPSELLMRRPDILGAEESLLAANANIGAARAAFFPSISLTGQYGSASRDLNGLFKAGTAAWSFMPQITLPIFSGGANRANLNLAHVQKNIAIAQYEKAIQSAFREVADALAARGTYDEQLTSLERYASATQRRLDLSKLRYENGIDSYLNVLTAQTDLYAVQQQVTTTRLGRLSNLIDLYQCLGGGWLEQTGAQPRPADAPVARKNT